jgi:hypothetical protein
VEPDTEYKPAFGAFKFRPGLPNTFEPVAHFAGADIVRRGVFNDALHDLPNRLGTAKQSFSLGLPLVRAHFPQVFNVFH